ncbi:TetR/AcrR family transcriptional regulator [Vallitalea guaymasensis]|uniref:TetR/AcrR family transcriptional regulator n=1 Tax=Vallitalea guaymasensis TaxID=1185412 RepID=A0A8J8M814_9FIRM|nr:TetR/AcrR family transcriptional regulator [Vallitalea guaymasensis]QUH28071.1 TetR/AcrR family transcriptional regulator [Vallitalea guaymasensis]
MRSNTKTQDKLLEIGKQEFLKNGFKSASLRKIVKEAGFTLGAFYGYYKDKEALFDGLVGEVAEDLFSTFRAAQNSHFNLIDCDKTIDTRELTMEYLKYFMNYIYDNFDEFKLLICCADGTKYENFIDDLVIIDVERTTEYYETLRKLGKVEGNVSQQLHHMLTSAYFTAVFETVAHDMPKEEAVSYIEQLALFFNNGWDSLIKFK